jgi:hypothetical protein
MHVQKIFLHYTKGVCLLGTMFTKEEIERAKMSPSFPREYELQNYKGRPKPMLPEDIRDAKKMPDGSYKCLTCQTEEIQDMIVRVTPNSDRAKEIIAERAAKQKKELEFKRLNHK